MERKEKLFSFLKFLEKKLGFDFNKDSFDDRLRLQKYVYIARFLGLDHGYRFSGYLRGPYSPDLAKDYYTLSESDELKVSKEDYLHSLENFNAEKFLDIVSEKSSRWLELATTVLYFWEIYRSVHSGEELANRVIDKVSQIKSRASRDEVSEIFAELERKGVLLS